MSETTTNLREAENNIKAVGILSEKSLETFKNDDGGTGIKGSISLQTSEMNTITFNVYVNEFTKDKKPNKAFAGINTIMLEAKSVADVGKADADWLSITSGKLNPNTYIDSNTYEVKESMRYQNNYFNRVKEGEKDKVTFGATFTAELYITAITEEVNRDGETTGRAIVRGWMPTYNGIEQVKLIAPEEGGIADAVLDAYEVGQTVVFDGDVVSSKTVTTKEIQRKIGANKIEETVTYVNELIITGASEPWDEDHARYYSADVIKKAVTEREAKIEEMKAKAKSGKSTQRTGAANVAGVQTANTGRRMPGAW